MPRSRRQSFVSRIIHLHSIHPSNDDDNNNTTNNGLTNQNVLSIEPSITIRNNPLTATISAPEITSNSSSSLQPMSVANNADNKSPRNVTTSQLIANITTINPNIQPPRNSHSIFAKLTDARKSLFGKTNVPDPFFSSAEENKALLSYILSEPHPELAMIQEFERNGAQLNAITDEGNTALHLLARAEIQTTECINIVDYLIRKGCDPNRQNDYGWTAAHYALASRNNDLIIYLLKVMVDVNLSTFDAHNGYPSQTQLLHIAARKNDSVLIRLLIKTYRARVNIFDEDGCTPLHICCYENNIDALKALLENDADFQKGTRLNPQETPITICVKYQHDLCLKILFELTINFNWKRYLSQLPRSPLLCDFPSIYAIELLVQHSLDIDACDERGNTFLHYLVNKKDVDYDKYIEKLIELSVDFNRQNHLGRTPFLEALEQKNFQLITAFFRHIELTNINIVDSLSNTALHYCKYLDDNFVYDTVLKSSPLSLNTQNRDGQTPLHDAILYDNYPFAQYLLQNSADVSLTNKDGNTPLHLAARDDNIKMCRLLMKYPQLDLIAVNKMGKTPLHLACANEKPNVAAILINKMKTDQMNLLDIEGRTPLHECADNINGSLAKYLIRHGADGNAKDIGENTPLHSATEKGNIELVRTLIKSSNVDINLSNADNQSPLALAILYNHDDVSKFLLNQDNVHVQLTDLKMAIQMNNYEMIKLLIEKDRNCLRVRSTTHGDMIIHIFMRKDFNNLVCLETLLSFISDSDLLTYLSERSLTFGDNLLHIAAREDTPNALTCFLNLSRVKFWFWANMMLTKNSENKTPMELANKFRHYAVIKLINFKWKESYEYLSHSLRDGHCGVSLTGVTQAKRQCFTCDQTGLIESTSGQNIRPCAKCNVCLYKSLDNSMQIFLALLFSDESSTIALDIMDSLIVVNEVQKAIHLYLDHIEPWEEYDKIDLSESSNLNQLVFAAASRMPHAKNRARETSSTLPLVQINAGASSSSLATNKSVGPSPNINPFINPTRPSFTNASESTTYPSYVPSTPGTTKFRPDGTHYRPITPLEAIYYHERLDLITHPLIKGLIKWKWDNYAARHFYLRLAFEVLFLILWTCISLIGQFPIRHIYSFPQDIWRCVLWTGSIGFLIGAFILEIYDIIYARKRYEDYLIWESERTQNRLDLISKNKYKSTTALQSTNNNLRKLENDAGDTEHITINETTTGTNISSNVTLPGMRSHHSQHNPLPPTIPTIIKGKPSEPLPNQQQPLDVSINPIDSSNNFMNGSKKKSGFNDTKNTSEKNQPVTSSRFVQFLQRFKTSAKKRYKSYDMYYSLNNLFDWIVYLLCLTTIITHVIDIRYHTVTRARIHMYVASVTVLCIWFRFMVFFRTISISFKTLRAKIVEVKLGELVIMVRMMFDDIIRFLSVFAFLLLPYAFVFFAVFGRKQIIATDYDKTPELCENALLHCPIVEIITSKDNDSDPLENNHRYVFNGTSSNAGDLCYNATHSCHLIEPDGFDTFYSLLFSIFRIALVDDIPVAAFNLIDRHFAAFVCSTYLLFTAILAVNIFIGLISNALQTEAFSTVEARFLLERITVILNCEWRFSARRRLQLQEMIHRQCSPLQLDWKDINFNAFGHSREEQQAKAFTHFRQTIDKHNIHFNTFRIQVQQKLNDIDSTLTKLQSTTIISKQNLAKITPTLQENTKQTDTTNIQSLSSKDSLINQSTEQLSKVQPSSITEPTINIAEELTRLRELLEETLAGQNDRIINTTRTLPGSMSSIASTKRPSAASITSSHRQQINLPPPTGTHITTHVEPFSQNLNERITDLQLAVNRLHQDVTSIRQVIERMSPLTTSLILGRTTGRR
ncbi:unnamed protein product [Rotaria sordida]|uniref:Ion transport domain-containing protein n=2 Tax=Rotaria sordida TaxID=392033 RepID=A0A818WJF2_9BILA|nr:unnamed protein product [Rotaria sordida]CAF3725922.1 unnamed protein product [Rotaria sordida]